MKSNCLQSFLAVSILALSSSIAQESEPGASEIAQKSNQAYASAFEKGDAEALANLFTKDARYVTETGETIAGREKIQLRAESFFKASKDRKMTITVESARFLTPDVLIENGTANTINGGGESATSRYSATHVKAGDAWHIADLREIASLSSDSGADALAELSWMIGEWTAGGENWTATTKAMWTLNGRFIARTFSIKQNDEDETFEGAEVIGYDHVTESIRSWTLDSEGGQGQSTWTNEGRKWLVNARMTLPDGEQSTAAHTFTNVEDGRFTVESSNRMVDGQALPNTDLIEVTRVEK